MIFLRHEEILFVTRRFPGAGYGGTFPPPRGDLFVTRNILCHEEIPLRREEHSPSRGDFLRHEEHSLRHEEISRREEHSLRHEEIFPRGGEHSPRREEHFPRRDEILFAARKKPSSGEEILSPRGTVLRRRGDFLAGDDPGIAAGGSSLAGRSRVFGPPLRLRLLCCSESAQPRCPSRKRPSPSVASRPERALRRSHPPRACRRGAAEVDPHLDGTGPWKAGPVTMKWSPPARGQVLGQVLPPSYTAALRVASTVGEPEVLLDSNEMRVRHADMKASRRGQRGCRLARAGRRPAWPASPASRQCSRRPTPSCRSSSGRAGSSAARARHFGEYSTEAADAGRVERAGRDRPGGAEGLLLGSGFASTIRRSVGRDRRRGPRSLVLESGAARPRSADVDRLFDRAAKPSPTLNLEEFTLAISLTRFVFVRRRRSSAGSGFATRSFFEAPVGRSSAPEELPPKNRPTRTAPATSESPARTAACSPRGRPRIHAPRFSTPAPRAARRPKTSSPRIDRLQSIARRASSTYDGVASATAHALEEPLNDLAAAPGRHHLGPAGHGARSGSPAGRP